MVQCSTELCTVTFSKCKCGLHSTAARFQMGSWSISPRIYTQILVPLRHLHTNAKPKFIKAVVDRCFNARHRFSKQRWYIVQDFCVGIADPSFHELASSYAKLWLCVVRPVVNFAGAENCPFLTPCSPPER